MNNWISVKDKLPEDGQEVLVLYQDVDWLYLDVGICWIYPDGPMFTLNSPNGMDGVVRFWQPAPQYSEKMSEMS